MSIYVEALSVLQIQYVSAAEISVRKPNLIALLCSTKLRKQSLPESVNSESLNSKFTFLFDHNSTMYN